jgi:PTH1 family peptidyl-tRNA hydrolase
LGSNLIVGLGNPGREYARTRHNLGFMVVDKLAETLRAEMVPGKGDYVIGEAFYLKSPVYLVKPLTFVNGSGTAVLDARERLSIPLADILVICDDCELPFGMVRLRGRGSDGGHRGLESIIYHLRSEEFPRLRIGIGKVPSVDLTEYVLGDFRPGEAEELPTVTEEAERAVGLFLELGVDRAMSLVNRRAEVE